MKSKFKKTKQRKLDFDNFQCKLLMKIGLNESGFKQYKENGKPLQKIGCAWSGINQRLDDIPLFYYGTQNGLLVKLEMKDSNQGTNQKKIQDNIDYDNNQKLQIINESRHLIERAGEINDGSSIDKSHSHNFNIQAIRVFDQKQPCYQVGQLEKNIIISGKNDDKFQLQIYDLDFNLIKILENSVASQHFTRSYDNTLIYRSTISFEQPSKIMFARIVNQQLRKYQKSITLEDKSLFPTTIFADEGFLFVGLYQKKIYVYGIKKRKLIRIINPEINTHVKKIVYNNSQKILAVVSQEDQISFVNLIDGKLLQQYTLGQIFKLEQINFLSNYEIFLFTFITPEIVLIGGSFPYLFFFEWRTGKILRTYVDSGNFVGVIFYNNFMYLTHEKTSEISILQ